MDNYTELKKEHDELQQIFDEALPAEPAPAEGVTLRMTYMWRQTPCSVIDVDFLRQRLTVRNMTDDMLHRAFGVNQSPTWEDLDLFLRERCFSESRGMRRNCCMSWAWTSTTRCRSWRRPEGAHRTMICGCDSVFMGVSRTVRSIDL